MQAEATSGDTQMKTIFGLEREGTAKPSVKPWRWSRPACLTHEETMFRIHTCIACKKQVPSNSSKRITTGKYCCRSSACIHEAYKLYPRPQVYRPVGPAPAPAIQVKEPLETVKEYIANNPSSYLPTILRCVLIECTKRNIFTTPEGLIRFIQLVLEK